METEKCIVYVVHEKELGGATLSLLDFLDKMPVGIKIYVLSNFRKGQAVNAFRKRKIKVFFAPYWRWSYKDKSSKKIIRAGKWIIYCGLNILNIISAVYAAMRISRIHPNIIHSNTSVIPQGALVAKILRTKHIWHMREFGEEDLQYKFVFPPQSCIKFMNANTDSYIYISKAIQRKYENMLSVNKGKVLYDYVSERYLHKKEYKKNNILKLLIAGKIKESKGQTTACDALKILLDKGCTNILLYIAGTGEIKKLKEYIREKGIDKYVRIMGRIEDMELLRRDMDIELVCSKCEAFGRITIEAMMGGNPVIGSNVGGTVELVKDGYNGYLYKEGNAEDLADKIESFYNNRENIRMLGENAYLSVCQSNNADKYIQELMKIYNE